MNIPVTEIYEDFFEAVESETLALKTAFLARKALYKYLKNSITRFRTCKKNITLTGNIIGDGEINIGDNTFIIDKSCPMQPNLEVYYILDDRGSVELENKTDYTVQELEDGKYSVVLNENAIHQTYVDYFLDGELVIDSEEGLTMLERRIIVEGMVLEWLAPQINREDNLKQRVANKEFKKLSNATMLNSLVKIDAHRKEEYKNLIVEYSYRNFKGFN